MNVKEEILHVVWKFGLVNLLNCYTSDGQKIEVVTPGTYNALDSGPDFLAAKIRIDNTLWVGNVEIHTKTTDWYNHLHHLDPAYQNVILHVVYENDCGALEGVKNIPLIELKRCVDPDVWEKIESIEKSKKSIPCSNWLSAIQPIDWVVWQDRLLVERFERKAKEVAVLFKLFDKNWEKVCFGLLARSLGGTTNKEPFQILSRLLPIEIVKKHRDNLLSVEALLFGVAGMLSEDFKDLYPNKLKSEFQFLKNKYQLEVMDGAWWKWLRLRPTSFPTIQIALLASLLHHSKRLDSIFDLEDFKLFSNFVFENSQVSSYWENHYKFDQISKEKPKNWGKESVKKIFINCVVPYQIHRFSEDDIMPYLERLSQIKPEGNRVVRAWEANGLKIKSAYESQAFIQLSNDYCSRKKCLNCNIGLKVLKGN